MCELILDISGNTHKNDIKYFERMVDELKAVDSGKHNITIKHQLFEKAGNNVPTTHEFFKAAYDYAAKQGYKTTSSVFDKNSLAFLLQFDVPFIKIANNRSLDYLIEHIPLDIEVYVSFSPSEAFCINLKRLHSLKLLACVSSYPAKFEDYFNHSLIDLTIGISDHTTDWELFNWANPTTYECHYKLDDSTGLDSGDFARTPKQLKVIM